MAGRRWTDIELNVLRDKAGELSSTDIGALIGRTKHAVQMQANRMGISLDGYCKKIPCFGCGTRISVSWRANVDTLCPICRDRRNRRSWHENSLSQYDQAFDGMRSMIFERDGYRCRVCGATKNLIIHHINEKSYHSGGHADNDPLNLTTLCRSCHTRHHNSKAQGGEGNVS